MDIEPFFTDEATEERMNVQFSDNQVGSTVRFVDPITTFYSVAEVLEIFDAQPDLTAIPVEGDHGVQGLIHLADIRNERKGIFGLGDKKVLNVYRSPKFFLDAREGIEKALQIILKEHEDEIGLDIPVFYHGRYFAMTNFLMLSRKYNNNHDMDLQNARDLQQHLMARSRFQDIGCQINIFNKMAYTLGGDFYKIVKMTPTLSLIAIFDVSGKGVAGSLSTAIISSFFTSLEAAGVLGGLNPTEVVRLLNLTLFDQTLSDLFVTALFVFVDTERNEFRILNCGHNELWAKDMSSNEIKEYPATLPPLGIMDELPPLDKATQIISLSGDIQILIYSDGLTELRDEDGGEFGTGRLRDFILEMPKASTAELAEALAKRVEVFRGNAPQTDDITFMAIQSQTSRSHVLSVGSSAFETAVKLLKPQPGITASFALTPRRPGENKVLVYGSLYQTADSILLLARKPGHFPNRAYLYRDGVLTMFDGTSEPLAVKTGTPFYESELTLPRLTAHTRIREANYVSLAEAVSQGQTYYRFSLDLGKERIHLTTRTDNLLPVQIDFPKDDAKPDFVIAYRNWTGVGDSYFPTQIVIIDKTKEGYKTDLILSQVQARPIAADTFDPEAILAKVRS